MCKDYPTLIDFEGNRDAETLFVKGFMSSMRNVSTSEFLFKYSRNKEYCKFLDNIYNEFFVNHMENLLIENLLPIDTVLKMTEIKSISEEMVKYFIRASKENLTIMEKDARIVLIQELTAPGRFFNLFNEEGMR